MAHILVVDDDESFRLYLVTLLGQAGHTVLEADNGQSALEWCASAPVDLIITDIFMPKMDGIDLLAAVRADRPQVKVIAISGGYKAMSSRVTLEMATSFGAVDIINKPFQAGTVLQKVTRALESTDAEPIKDI
ncbi:MAG: response regulator [Magnetococcales bacterium]|nr:response regulator [Magnetococcales bacterium]